MKERYYYNLLSPDEKRIYDAFYDGVRKLMPEITIPNRSYTRDSSNHVFQAILSDNPDIFYLSPRNCKTRMSASEYTIIPEYLYSREQINEVTSQISRKSSEIISRICSIAGRDDVKREKELYRYFQQNYKYDEASKGSENPAVVRIAYTMVGPILYNRAVCDGFSKAYMFLLDAMDIRCIYVAGAGRKDGYINPNHAWNIVWHHGRTYHSDVTWDIPLQYDGTDVFEHLDLSDEAISLNHTGFSRVPKCSYKDLEYFGNTGAIVGSQKEIEQLLIDAVRRRKNLVEFKVNPKKMRVGNTSYKGVAKDCIKKAFNEYGKGGITFAIRERIETGVVQIKFSYEG